MTAFLGLIFSALKTAALFLTAYGFLSGGQRRAFAFTALAAGVLGAGIGLSLGLSDAQRDGLQKAFFAFSSVFLLLGMALPSRWFKEDIPWKGTLCLRLCLCLLGVSLTLFPLMGIAYSFKVAVVSGGAYLLGVFAIVLIAGGVFALRQAFKRLNPSRVFTPDGLVVALASLNLLLPLPQGFSHLGFVTTAEGAIARYLVKVVASGASLLLLPEHEFITTPAQRVTGFLKGPEVSLTLTALLILLPPLITAMRAMLLPEPDTAPLRVAAQKRKKLSAFRADVLLRAAPVVIVLVFNYAVLHTANLSANPVWDPEPAPLISEGGELKIPLGEEARPPAMRKFSVGAGGARIVILTMMRPDGEVVACLDACEICPPEGYGQKGNVLICKYCNTPIPLITLGKPGGCNPIPLKSELRGDYLVIKTEELISAYGGAGKKFGQWH